MDKHHHFVRMLKINASWMNQLVLAAAFSMFFTFPSLGQGLDLIGKVKADGGGLSDAKVVVMKEGKKVKTLNNGLSKFELQLDFNSTYVLVFEKKGYVTKKLQFNTGVPKSMAEKEFAPFGFTVNLFEQYDDVNIVVFNQPVGMINYEGDIEEFDYDTDYTKSIQSQLDAAMKEMAQAKKAAEKQAKKDEKAKAKQEALAKKTADAEKKKEEALVVEEKKEQPKQLDKKPESIVEATPRKEEKVVAAKPILPDPDRAAVNTGQEGRRSISVNEGFEENPIKKAKANTGFEEQPEVVKEEIATERFEDTIVEKSKIITKVRFVQGEKTTEYLKVYHKWGGTFYFKNGTSCSQNVFELETMGFDLMAMP